MDARYQLPSPGTDDPRYVHPSHQQQHSDEDLQELAHFYRQQHGEMAWAQSHHGHGHNAHHPGELRHASSLGNLSLTGATRPMHAYYSNVQQSQGPPVLPPPASLSALSAAPSSSFPSLGSSVLPAPPSPPERLPMLQHPQHPQHHSHHHNISTNTTTRASSRRSRTRSARFAGEQSPSANSTLLTPLPGYEPDAELMQPLEQRGYGGEREGAMMGMGSRDEYE
ncbi:hypothetical protein B0H21DRAFT_824314 [Amylocystis lapponica]|nr:hypothetical protein B0H21DRAFT_824314 [Amylocystis lapponica]